MIVPGITRQFTATPEQVIGEWQHRTPDYADFLKANVTEGFEHTLTDVAITEGRVVQAEKEAGTYDPLYGQFEGERAALGFETAHPHTMSEQDWKTSEWYRERDGKAAIAYTPNMTPERAQIYAEDYDKREFRQMLIAQGKDAFGFWGGSTAGFFAGMLGNLPDPINAIPFGSALGAGKGVMHGIKTGMLEGALGAAAVDAVVLPSLANRGVDVGFADFALDVAFGGFIGGGLGGAGGGLGKWQESRTARAAEVRRAWLAAQEAEAAAKRVEYEQTHGPFMEAGRDRFLDAAGEEGRASFLETPDAFLARNETGDFPRRDLPRDELTDFIRRNFHGEERQTVLRAAQLAVEDFAAGRPVDVGQILRGSPVERYIEGRIAAPDDIVAFFRRAVEEPNHQAPKVMPYHNVTLTAAMRVYNETGVNLTGYTHFIDESSARHISGKHFGAAEVNPTNVPLRANDLRLLPAVLEDFDSVKVSGKHQYSTTLLYQKKLSDGTVFFVEAVRQKKKRLVPVSLWKEAAEGDVPANAVPAHYVQKRVAAVEQNIGPSNSEVNRFAVEAPEDFIPALPVSKEVRSALDEMGVDPKTGMTMEEIRAVEQIEQGKAPREEAEAFMREQEAETVREKMEEAGYAALDCILEVIE